LEAMAQTPNLKGSARENLLIRELATRLFIDERTVRRGLDALRRNVAQKPAWSAPVSETPQETTKLSLTTSEDLIEAELLEALVTQPELVTSLQVRVNAGQFENPILQRLFQLALDLWERDVLPSLDAMLAELEDPALKQALIKIDGLAQEKNIAHKLKQDQSEGSSSGLNEYLEQVVRRLHLQSEKQEFESLKGGLVQTSSQDAPSAKDGSTKAGTLNQEHLHYLLAAQKFHAKRANS